ncbi:hypothetical protein Fcan01_15361 [Folsomia candida]|uniref:Uncharacterized protein n=1 Tax=Folsomia candida TaxID=158441 RepID=A0A226DXP3_FOLCA|nr:hypothetical protein Fcan01_15361 [Folsomia candida]
MTNKIWTFLILAFLKFRVISSLHFQDSILVFKNCRVTIVTSSKDTIDSIEVRLIRKIAPLYLIHLAKTSKPAQLPLPYFTRNRSVSPTSIEDTSKTKVKLNCKAIIFIAGNLLDYNVLDKAARKVRQNIFHTSSQNYLNYFTHTYIGLVLGHISSERHQKQLKNRFYWTKGYYKAFMLISFEHSVSSIAVTYNYWCCSAVSTDAEGLRKLKPIFSDTEAMLGVKILENGIHLDLLNANWCYENVRVPKTWEITLKHFATNPGWYRIRGDDIQKHILVWIIKLHKNLNVHQLLDILPRVSKTSTKLFSEDYFKSVENEYYQKVIGGRLLLNYSDLVNNDKDVLFWTERSFSSLTCSSIISGNNFGFDAYYRPYEGEVWISIITLITLVSICASIRAAITEPKNYELVCNINGFCGTLIQRNS